MDPQPKKYLSPVTAWAVVVFFVGVVGFSTWYYYDQIDTTYADSGNMLAPVNHTKTSTSTKATDTTSKNLSYSNAAYGFKMTFPSTWKGYKLKEATIDGTTMVYYIELPTTDTPAEAGTTNDAGYYSPFAISVYTLNQWETAQSAEGAKTDVLITKNSKYAFAWSQANGIPASDFGSKTADIKTIIASFKLE